jgi:DNA-binding protein
MYISEHTIKKILKEAGAKRISADASMEMQKCINKMAFNVAQKAVVLSKHAKRKTVDVSDVKLACNS